MPEAEDHTIPVIAPPDAPHDSPNPAPKLVVDRENPHLQRLAAKIGWDKIERIAKD